MIKLDKSVLVGIFHSLPSYKKSIKDRKIYGKELHKEIDGLDIHLDDKNYLHQTVRDW